jgi:hypothetical protein
MVLIGVDLCVGPLLTLIVFRSGKRGMRFDLVCIAVLQAFALAYGMSVVVQARPIFLVAAIDRFELVAANEVTDDDLAQGSQPEFRSRSWTGPRLVAAILPTDTEERNQLVFSGVGGRDLQNLPKYYRDFEADGSALASRSQAMSALRNKDPANATVVDNWLAKMERPADSLRWVPLRGTKADDVIVIDAKTAHPLGTLPLNPW